MWAEKFLELSASSRMILSTSINLIDFPQASHSLPIGPPKGIGVRNSIFRPKNHDFCILPNNLNFGLSEIVEGTFLKIPILRQNLEF